MIKETLREWCPDAIHQLYADTKYYFRFKFYPQGLANEMHRGLVGYNINWKNPQTLNEKINWMKFNYDTSDWTRLADKYLVRDYVKDRIGENVLVKLYGVWEKAEDIDFNTLPNQFVLKTNHGAGTIICVKDKNNLDISSTRKQLNEWLKIRFGYDTVEPHYLKIKPLIIAEQYLENDAEFSSALVDYKVYCFSGKPFCILVCTNRVIGKKSHFSYYDCEWNPLVDVLVPSQRNNSVHVPKPECLDLLLEYASKLSIGHPQVRVDFYIVKNKIVFGEMTFTNEGGYDGDITKEFCIEMGSHIALPI